MVPVIEVKNIRMVFNLMEERVDTLKEYVMRFIKGQLFYNEFVSLDDVSFTVDKGDILGIVGFKILAGVLKPTAGSVSVKGSIAPLIEVGAGFDPELTARENIYLNGAILGYSRKFLDAHFDQIIAFAELESFVNVPIKNFSSGMYARLGFAIATVVDPDILIVDEVLSVGDYRFKEKCIKRIKKMIDQGTTIIIVSHEIDLIEEVCNKVLWLDHGKVKGIGNTDEICEAYKVS